MLPARHVSNGAFRAVLPLSLTVPIFDASAEAQALVPPTNSVAFDFVDASSPRTLLARGEPETRRDLPENDMPRASDLRTDKDRDIDRRTLSTASRPPMRKTSEMHKNRTAMRIKKQPAKMSRRGLIPVQEWQVYDAPEPYPWVHTAQSVPMREREAQKSAGGGGDSSG